MTAKLVAGPALRKQALKVLKEKDVRLSEMHPRMYPTGERENTLERIQQIEGMDVVKRTR